MTTADAQHARPGGITRAWRGFRRWRRSRPFWGGLFTVLAGAEVFGSTQTTLAGLTLKMGPTGFLAWLIPTILVACGLLMWFTPQQRIFYSVIAVVTAVYSLIGVNFGGFGCGMLLGIVGACLGFAWMPGRPSAPTGEPAPAVGHDPEQGDEAEEELALVDELLPRQREEETTGVLTDTLPEPRNPLRETAPTEPPADSTQVLPPARADTPPGRHRDPKLYAILLVLASMSMVGLLGLRGEEVALASPAGCPTPSSAAPSPSASTPDLASPSPAPTEQGSDGNLLTDVADGVTRLFTGGHSADAAVAPLPAPIGATAPVAVAAEPTATETTAAPTASTSPTPKPTVPGRPHAHPCASPTQTRPEPVEVGEPLPRIAADPGQSRVAARPAKLTGSKVTMTALRLDGVVELPTADGPLKCLKFSMDKGVTDDFVLEADGPAGRHQRYVTNQLTVEGDVAFYATRFVGWLAGVKITLTPDLPLPDGLPVTSPAPVTFTDPVIDLAFVDSRTLTAKPALKLDLA